MATNTETSVARRTPPRKTRPHESGQHRIQRDALLRALADGTLTWFELERDFGVGPSNDEDNDS